MISLKKYLDSAESGIGDRGDEEDRGTVQVVIDAYRSALIEMGNCSVDACPALGPDLKRSLAGLVERLYAEVSPELVASTRSCTRERLQDWGRRTARHYEQKAAEVKELLLVVARTAESVGDRDLRCAQQMDEVTTRLKSIANLEDVTEIRASIERSASDLKTSIDRMTAEGKAVVQQLQGQVSAYQSRLEEAEYIASCDPLTGLGSRPWVEGQLQQRINAAQAFCAVMIDIDEFKRVNDDHGHLVGDELLKQFAGELRSACRSGDMIGRWGGDEFLVLFDGGIEAAHTHAEQLRAWVCGNYTVQGRHGPQKIRVEASFGLAEHTVGKTLKELLDQADAQMYLLKGVSRANRKGMKRQGLREME
jgi:diguanylate cyclase (GGDEF)-like protein